jgi:hypothetical protein
MSAVFSEDDVAFLSRPHIARAWFAGLDLPSGFSRLHSGFGRVTIGSDVWLGVSDPISGRLVGVEQVEEPTFGQAAAVTLTVSGANKEFIQSVKADARAIEGRSADIYWAAFDPETQTLWSKGLVKLFPRGRMTAPAIQWSGIGIRTVSITVESSWATQNFAPGGRWNSAGQRQRFPDDLGLDYVGIDVQEGWK